MVDPEAYLMERTERGETRRHLLGSRDTVVGRDSDCDIVLASADVSRRHALIHREAGRLLLRDLGSTNGTWLNGVRLSSEAVIHHGDAIRLASADLRVLLEDSPTTAVLSLSGSALLIDASTRTARVDGREVSLAPKEYALLAFLVETPNEARARTEIAEAVWPEFDGAVSPENLDQLVARVRRKIEASPAGPERLLTVRGFGYRLVID